jgi:hypothetical protein
MVAAVAILCQEKAVQPLVALVQRLPPSLRGSHVWLLIGAILAAVRDHSDRSLRELARQHRHRDPRMQRVARFARVLLSNRDAVAAALRVQVKDADADPLDEQLLLRAPWTQVARIDPAAVRALEKLLPTQASWEADQLSLRWDHRSGVRSQA